MLNKESILSSIALSGSASKDSAIILQHLPSHPNAIIDSSSGLARIRTNLVSQFKLILSQPLALSSLSNFKIRCCLCHEVITYPCWYYNVKYVLNHFHYFVCFDSESHRKVNCKCFRVRG